MAIKFIMGKQYKANWDLVLKHPKYRPGHHDYLQEDCLDTFTYIQTNQDNISFFKTQDGQRVSYLWFCECFEPVDGTNHKEQLILDKIKYLDNKFKKRKLQPCT